MERGKMKDKQWLIIAIIIALSILGYGYMNYTQKMKVLESERQSKVEDIKREEEQERNREIKLTTCKGIAVEDYTNYWNAQCKVAGLNKKTEGCTLPKYIADDIEARKEKAIENCIKLYAK